MSASSSRILVCGVGPAPLGDTDRLYAPGLRLLVFSRALLEAGCAVDLLEIRFGEAESGGRARLHAMRLDPKEPPEPLTDLAADSRDLPPGPPAELVARTLEAKPYDGIVSTTDVMNRACAEACGDTPLWCDFNGHPMAERQALAYVYGSDEGLAAQWDYLIAPLLRGDRFSAVSEAQRLALVGELGACGRLNRLTDGYPLAVSLPLVPVFSRFEHTQTVLRGKIVPEDAFVVLWTGGYNTWADVDTLASALIEAMQRDRRIHYVSTGGEIAGHDDRTFGRFRERIDASPCAARCRFVGWVKTREVANYYLEADVGVNCDRSTLEAELGARNRVMDWVCAGLPVISTCLCELTQRLAERGMIETFEPGDVSALTELLIKAAGNRESLRAKAKESRERLLREFTPAKLHRDLIEWAQSPRRAPDLAGNSVRLEGIPYSLPDNPLARRRAEEWLASRAGVAPSSRQSLFRRFIARLKPRHPYLRREKSKTRAEI